jgi:hypothetical protein
MLIQIILASIGLLLILVGAMNQDHSQFNLKQQRNLAIETAIAWNNFSQSLNDYVKNNANNIGASTIISCQTLQSDGYYNGSCTDPLGVVMEGVIAAPYGFAQSWGAIPASSPSMGTLSKYGLGTTANSQSILWMGFLHKVSVILQGDGLVSAVYNSSNQTFMEPFSSVVSKYSDYSLPASPISFGNNSDNSGVSGLMSFSQLKKEPGYELWQVQLLDSGSNYSSTNASINFINYGYSSVCPPGGIVPSQWNSYFISPNGVGYTSDSNVAYFNNNNQLNGNNNYKGLFSYFIDAGNDVAFKQVLVCLPAPESLVNTSVTYNPFPVGGSPSSFYSNSDSSASNFYSGINLSNNWDAVSGAAVQDTILISIGKLQFTLMAYAGETGSSFPGGEWNPRSLGVALLDGPPPGGSSSVNFSPSYFGEGDFTAVNDNSTNGYMAVPIISATLNNINLS